MLGFAKIETENRQDAPRQPAGLPLRYGLPVFTRPSGSPTVADAPLFVQLSAPRFLATRTRPLQVQGPFFGYFLLGLEKKVTRLPAGTGEVKILILLGV
jgi:hypothetical protein